MINHLAFLKKFFVEGEHYNFNQIVDSHQGPINNVELSSLKEFSDDELTKLAPKIKLRRFNTYGSELSTLLQSKSKNVLPNMVANYIATNDQEIFSGMQIKPHHHILIKFPGLTSETVRDFSITAASNKSGSRRDAIHTISAEALHHPNLTKDHAKEIVDSARSGKSPYLAQMERQFNRRYGKS